MSLLNYYAEKVVELSYRSIIMAIIIFLVTFATLFVTEVFWGTLLDQWLISWFIPRILSPI